MRFKNNNRWYAVLLALALFSSKAGADEHSQTIKQNIDELIRTNSCVGCDLRGADLNRMILADADLSNADLGGATFFLADLSGANLSGANLRDAKFGGADLANADLRGADLRGALLDGAFLKGSLMDGTVVEAETEDIGAEEGAGEKVYVPDESKPKKVIDQNQATLTESSEEIVEAAPPEADLGQGEKMSKTAAARDRKQDVNTAEAARTAIAAAPPHRTVQDQPKELMDQKKSAAPDQSVKPESSEAMVVPGQAPPVKIPVPVKAAQLEGTQQGTPPQSDAAKLSPEEAKPVPQANPQNIGEVEETDLIEKVAAAPLQEQEAVVEEDLSKDAETGNMIEKLLDTKRCYECNLSGVDLSGRNLGGSDLEGSDLSDAVLNDTDLAGANLKGVSLRGAQMRNADLRKADLYKADLSGADLTDADLRGALTDDADFSGAIGYLPSLMVE